MEKIFIGISALVVLLLPAMLVEPAMIPVNAYEKQILLQIDGATGRAARIGGDVKLSEHYGYHAGRIDPYCDSACRRPFK